MADVFEGATAGIKNMADNTLRLTIDIEPKFAVEAYTLFHARGTPVGIAALKTAAQLQAAAEQAPAPPPAEPLGPLCKWVVKRCRDPEFWAFLSEQVSSVPVTNEVEAALVVKEICRVESRKELDTNTQAALRLHEWVRRPYSQWLSERDRVESAFGAEH